VTALLSGASADAEPNASPAAGPAVPSAIPAGLPPLPATTRRRRTGAVAVAAVVSLPLLQVLASLVIGGGPRFERADDALLTMAMRDVTRGGVLIGPYSRFGWHHPGPVYLYVAGVTTWLWRGGPTGSWVGAALVAIVAAVATAVIVRRVVGRDAGWWMVAGVLVVVHGLGVNLFRDPWNPYVVILPVLFTAVAAALAAAGNRRALLWGLVMGTVAVQTHLSCAPVVVVLLAVALVAAARRGGDARAVAPGAHVPASLPTIPGRSARWWKRRPELAVGAALLLLAWIPPLWDEAFDTHNLTSIGDFFLHQHGTVGVVDAWRQVASVFGIVMFQHHAALRDGVNDPHPLLVTAVFVGLVAVAVIVGRRAHSPVAVWLGVMGGLASVLAVVSVTRIVGEPFKYLVIWMAALPVVPALGVVVALDSALRRAPIRRAAQVWPWVLAAVVVAAVSAALDAGIAAPPAAAYSSADVAAAWKLVAPVLPANRQPVRIVINDGSRWPVAAGLALELERGGYAARVDHDWALLFGSGRVASGTETVVLYVATQIPSNWPPAGDAVHLGTAGATNVFVRRSGPPCWTGWIPWGGPVCPAGRANNVR